VSIADPERRRLEREDGLNLIIPPGGLGRKVAEDSMPSFVLGGAHVDVMHLVGHCSVAVSHVTVRVLVPNALADSTAGKPVPFVAPPECSSTMGDLCPPEELPLGRRSLLRLDTGC